MEINEKKIFWPFVFILIIYNFIDGTIFMGINFLFILYLLVCKKKGRIPMLKIVNIKPLVLILILGSLIGGFYISYYDFRDYLRDIYNILQPLIFILVGYSFYSAYENRYCIYKSLVIASAIMALIYILKIAVNPSILLSSDVVQIRENIGKELYIHIITLTLLITKKNIFSKKTQLFFTVVIASVFTFQFSRASFGTIAIIFMIYILLQRKITIKMIKNGVIILIICVIFWSILPKELTSDFVERILKSSTEISYQNTFWNFDTIQSNWRGYESYIVMQLFNSSDIFKRFFGFGFGKTAYLRGITVLLGGGYYSSISVFHNGYIQILLKCGVLGVLLLIWFYLSNVIRFYNIRNKYKEYEYECNIIIAILISSLFLTYVKGGIFRGGSLYEMCILLGVISAKINLSIRIIKRNY